MNNALKNLLLAPLGWALHALSWMPWWWIWFSSDCVYLLFYYVLRYRRRIVRKNLAECFPETSEAERRKIEKDFYQAFTDYFFETIKMLHMSEDEMKRRMVFKNTEMLNNAIAQDRSVMLYASHCFNWEWLTSVSLWFSEETRAKNTFGGQAYHPLENEWFDQFFLRLRNRFTQCIPSHEVLKAMIGMRNENRPMILGFLSDQHPRPGHNGVIVKFLNHPTAIINGTEAIARKLNMVVGYFHVRKVKRGYYECTLDPMFENARDTERDEITKRYAQILEQHIHEAPALWLWTHNRWKRPVQFPEENN